MAKWNLKGSNEKGCCPPYEGPCDVGKPCSSTCRKYHKKRSNRARRVNNKKVIKDELSINNF